uniref:preprotein translocase subunit G n=1 Tax=Timspurckia oligopyrenoides TaxID=708627 RepID=UPI001FCDA9C0|nr:preprotein translocase subunit G [Timspurckia oligopyrenoides]UNJ17589.1 preprotein translocase subunit G [Timspurckia oligopyrenoides]
MTILKFFWYITGSLSGICIVINNPKSNSVGIMPTAGGSSLLKKNITKLTWVTTVSFVILTVILAT